MAMTWPTSDPCTQNRLRAGRGLETTRSWKRSSAGSVEVAGDGRGVPVGTVDSAAPLMTDILPSGLSRPCDAACPRQASSRPRSEPPLCPTSNSLAS